MPEMGFMGLKSGCVQGWFLLQVLGENPFLAFSSVYKPPACAGPQPPVQL